jgi:hypothetical protein
MIYYITNIISNIYGYNLYSHIAPFYDFNNFYNFNSSSILLSLIGHRASTKRRHLVLSPAILLTSLRQ